MLKTGSPKLDPYNVSKQPVPGTHPKELRNNTTSGRLQTTTELDLTSHTSDIPKGIIKKAVVATQNDSTLGTAPSQYLIHSD